jgi:stringent starvation protein B
MNSLEFSEWYWKMLRQKKEPVVMFEVYPDEVPGPLKQYIQDNTMTLSLAPKAIKELIINDETISFDASFNKKLFKIVYPYTRILEYYE